MAAETLSPIRNRFARTRFAERLVRGGPQTAMSSERAPSFDVQNPSGDDDANRRLKVGDQVADTHKVAGLDVRPARRAGSVGVLRKLIQPGNPGGTSLPKIAQVVRSCPTQIPSSQP